MNNCKGYSKLWFLALLPVAFAADCAGTDSAGQTSKGV
jgi:hypothetical protein